MKLMVLHMILTILLFQSVLTCVSNCDICDSQPDYCDICSDRYGLTEEGYCKAPTLGPDSIILIVVFSVIGFVCITCCIYTIYTCGQRQNNLPNPNNQIGSFQINNIASEVIDINWQNVSPNQRFDYSQTCNICLSSSLNVQTQCGHQFHSACLQSWFKTNPICPSCRSEVQNVTVFCNVCYQQCFHINMRFIPNINQYATICPTCIRGIE